MRIVFVSPEVLDFNKFQNVLKEMKRDSHSLFHYNHPLKAIDNLEEIQPQLIIWSYTDYPRHWKTLIPYSREIPALADLKIILYTNSHIDPKEIDKAETLKVAGIIQQGLSSPEALDCFSELIIPESAGDTGNSTSASRAYTSHTPQPISGSGLNAALDTLRYDPAQGTAATLIMSHPLSLKLIRGEVLAMDPDSIEFRPVNSNDLSGLPVGTLLKNSRLKVGDHRIQLDLKIQAMGNDFDLIIQDPEPEYIPLLTQLLHGKIS